MLLKRAFTYLFLFFVLTSCSNPVIVDQESLDTYPTVFLYATGLGELRLLNISYSKVDTVDTIYQVERYGNVGSQASYYGQVDLSWYNAYDINKFNPADTAVKVTAVLNKINTFTHEFNRAFRRQFIQINPSKRTQILQYYSFLNNRLQNLEQWNYPVNGDRAVSFINDDSYLVLFSDRWEQIADESPGIDIPYSRKSLHLIRYGFNSIQPELGEIITTFSIGDTRVDVPKDKPTAEGINLVHASANGEFYIVWAPFFNQLGSSPYILRTNATLAFNPGTVPFTWENRYFGQSMFAFEPHPTKDSVFVIGDINYRQVKVVELPRTLGTRFIELKTKTLEQLIPQSNSVSWATFQRQRAWYMSYNHAGTKLAITHSLPGVAPILTIWDTQTDVVNHYKVNKPGAEKYFSYMGKAAWDYSNKGLVYFMAGDTVGVDHASFFVFDVNNPTTYPKELDFSKFTFKSSGTETLTRATDLVGR